jgi:hypothetical protein
MLTQDFCTCALRHRGRWRRSAPGPSATRSGGYWDLAVLVPNPADRALVNRSQQQIEVFEGGSRAPPAVDGIPVRVAVGANYAPCADCRGAGGSWTAGKAVAG